MLQSQQLPSISRTHCILFCIKLFTWNALFCSSHGWLLLIGQIAAQMSRPQKTSLSTLSEGGTLILHPNYSFISPVYLIAKSYYNHYLACFCLFTCYLSISQNVIFMRAGT